MRIPILVTGSTRSGTTWTGSMLCLSGEAGYITEPFNVNYQPGWLVKGFPYQSLYICRDNSALYEATIADVVRARYPVGRNLSKVRSLRQAGRVARDWGRSLNHRARGLRPLLKDPYALFSAEWLAERFGMRLVIMIRHPAGFVSSIKRLNWRRDFRHWAEQELLLRDHLAPFAERIRDYARDGEALDIIDRAVLMWNCYYHVVDGYRKRHPDWIFVKYEELAENPLSGFEGLYQAVGLRWDQSIAQRVREYSSADNVKEVSSSQSPYMIKRDSRVAKDTWAKRLTPKEVHRIRVGVAEVASRYYDEGDWEPRSLQVES
jgi:hypothetical protein